MGELSRRTRRSVARAAAAVVSLLLVLSIAEVGARLVLPPQQVVEVEPAPDRPVPEALEEREQEGGIDVLLDWSGPHGLRLNPLVRATIHDHTLSRRDVVIETSSLGLRHPELGPKHPGQLRLLVLGDSITFGDYVPFDATYTAQLASLLGRSGRSVEVINAGLPGANSGDEFYRYLELRDPVAPDSVLLAMYLNDAQESQRFTARSLRAPWSESRFLSWVVNRSEALRLRLFTERAAPGVDPGWAEDFRAGRDLRSGDWRRDRDAFDFEIYNARRDFGLAWTAQAWSAVSEIVEVLERAVSARGQRFAVVLFPIRLQAETELDEVRPQIAFEAMCRDLGLACLDLLPALRAALEARRGRLYYDHCHLTEAGNAVAAETLADWLPRAGLVPR